MVSEKLSFPLMMQAVFLEKQDGSLIVKETPTPVPGPGEVLVKIAAAPVNPSDLARIRSANNEYDLTTFIPGLEGSGTVVAAGKGLLPALWKGKRVTCSSHYPASGTWAEYMVTAAGSCFPLSKKVTDEQGSMSLVNPLTALAFFEIAKQNRHKSIINNAAAGALGRMVELLGNRKKVPIINIVRSEEHVKKLEELGSKFVLNSSDPSFIDNFGKLSKELNATLLFDSVCSEGLSQMIDALPAKSTVIIYGNLTGAEQIMFNPRSLIDRKIKIEGFFLGTRSKENGLLKNMMNLLEVRRLMSTDMKINIQGRYQFAKAQEAVDTYLNNMSEGKILLMPEV
jgi:NADPH2:quinone reductase